MKFTCERQKLAEAINITQRAVPARASHAALEGILIQASDGFVTLTGNDLEIGVQCSVEAEVSQGQGDCIVVNSRVFGDITRKINGDVVTFSCTESATIKCGRSTYKINVMPADDYIRIPHVDVENSLEMTYGQFRDLVKHTIFAVGTNDAKIILTGCLLEAQDGVASMAGVDGFRLAVKKTNIDSKQQASFVIPAKTLNELVKILPDSDEILRIEYNEKSVVFNFANVMFTSRLLEGEFIDYRKIIPSSYKTTFTANVRELIDALERASLIITGESNKSPLVLSIERESITVNCENSVGAAEETIPMMVTGEPFKIGFNGRYLLDALKAVPDASAQVSFVGHVNPCLISPIEGEDYKYIVLPVRLKD